MLSLTEKQRVKAEENMGLAGRVIKDRVHTLDRGCIYPMAIYSRSGILGSVFAELNRKMMKIQQSQH